MLARLVLGARSLQAQAPAVFERGDRRYALLHRCLRLRSDWKWLRRVQAEKVRLKHCKRAEDRRHQRRAFAERHGRLCVRCRAADRQVG